MNRKTLLGVVLALGALAGAAILMIDHPVEPIHATAPTTTPSVGATIELPRESTGSTPVALKAEGGTGALD